LTQNFSYIRSSLCSRHIQSFKSVLQKLFVSLALKKYAPNELPGVAGTFFTSPQPNRIRPKEASDSDFTIEDVMLWLGTRFSLRSQCKHCSPGRLHNSLPYRSRSSHLYSTRRSLRIEDRMLPAHHGFEPTSSTITCPAYPPFYFTSLQPIRPKGAYDSAFTIEDVMLWPGMRFSLHSQCKRCSAGRLHIWIWRAKFSMTLPHSSLGIALIVAVIAAFRSGIVWGFLPYTLSLRYPHR